ncbi:MAG: M15 family metallopeptidase [Campylobacterota bacterium]
MKLLITLLLSLTLFAGDTTDYRTDAFTNVNEQIPSIKFDMRYNTTDNFIGGPIDGYKEPVCYLTNETALALQNVQNRLQKEGYSLKVFDCFRPQRAVDHFVRWAKEINETRMKSTYYPNVEKKDLFKEGYIAAKSGHSRGSTVDLTVDGLDMGTPFDFFDPRSHTNAQSVTKEQHNNRIYLKKVMEENGFKNYAEEWWHYTLKEEPFTEHYFDFVIE